MHPCNTVILTDSEYSHYAWAQQPRTEGGLGPNSCIPLLADRNIRVAREYGCLIEDKGITFRASYLDRSQGCAEADHDERFARLTVRR